MVYLILPAYGLDTVRRDGNNLGNKRAISIV